MEALELYENKMSYLGTNEFFTNKGVPKEAQPWLGEHALKILPMWRNIPSSEPFRFKFFKSLTSNQCSFIHIIEYVRQ